MYLILIKSLIEELHLIVLIGLSRFSADPCHDLTVLPYDLTDKGRIGYDNLVLPLTMRHLCITFIKCSLRK
jgi:hypothetical protein